MKTRRAASWLGLLLSVLMLPSLLGAEQPINLHLLEITPALPTLSGVVMELSDCAFSTLNKVVAFISGPESRGAERLVRTAQPYEVPVVVPSDLPPGTGQGDFISLDVPSARRGPCAIPGSDLLRLPRHEPNRPHRRSHFAAPPARLPHRR